MGEGARRHFPGRAYPTGRDDERKRIEARLLLIAEPVIELRERGLHGADRAERGLEPLLHGLDPTRGRERLIAGAVGLERVRRLGGRILQFVEGGALHQRGLHRLGNAIDRKIGHPRRALVAELAEVPLVFAGGGIAPR